MNDIVEFFDKDDFEELFGISVVVFNRYRFNRYEYRKAIANGGKYLLMEIIAKYWLERYFKYPVDSFKIGHRTNKGLDIISPDGKIRVEIKTTDHLDNGKYASFQSINCKRDSEGNLLFNYILFYSPVLSMEHVYLFKAEEVEALGLPKGDKLNIKPTLDESKYIDTKDSQINRWSQAFQKNKKYLLSDDN